MTFDFELTRPSLDNDGFGGQTIAPTLASPLGHQPSLFDQQGQAPLQHPRRQLRRQPVANGPDLHSARMMVRYDREDGVEFFFWNPLWHVAHYMSRKILTRHKSG